MTIRRPEPEFAPPRQTLNRRLLLIIPTALAILLVIALFAILRPAPKGSGPAVSAAAGALAPTRLAANAVFPAGKTTFTPFLPPTREPGIPVVSPTPDPPRQMPTPRMDPAQYTVKGGDSLGKIAQRYNVTWEEIAAANQLVNPDHLEAGQVLNIPPPRPGSGGPDFKVIPDFRAGLRAGEHWLRYRRLCRSEKWDPGPLFRGSGWRNFDRVSDHCPRCL